MTVGADTITAGCPLCRPASRFRLGDAAYHPTFRAMFSAVRRLFSTSVFMLVRPN